EASLVPTRTAADERFLWSRGDTDNAAGSALTLVQAAPRRVYDVQPRKPAWGWEVVAYTWTKSIATGSFLAVIASRLFDAADNFSRLAVALGCVSLLFVALTAALLVADLKQPKRFLFVLLRPQWKSWLVRGAYLLTGFGALLSVWLMAQLAG